MSKRLDRAELRCNQFVNTEFLRLELTGERARRDPCAAGAARHPDCRHCSGCGISCKTSPTSGTHISASRTSSRSFLGFCRWNNGNNILLSASISAAPVCPQASSRTSLGARYPVAVASKATYAAKNMVCRARACRAFSSGSRKKPIAPNGWNFCYRGPVTRYVNWPGRLRLQFNELVISNRLGLSSRGGVRTVPS